MHDPKPDEPRTEGDPDGQQVPDNEGTGTGDNDDENRGG
jgi:hypothetical protein